MEVEITATAKWLTLISRFMDKYAWLADSFVLDFYTESHWSLLPGSWKRFLVTLDPADLADLIDLERPGVPTPGSQIPPLSLLCFKQTIRVLSIQRSYDPSKFDSLLSKITAVPRPSDSKEFRNLFRRHVKLKKRHEVEQIGKVVFHLASKTGATRVFDVGSGMGHLSRYLTYEYGLQLTCVDKELRFGENASKFDKELKSFLDKKQISSALPEPPSHTIYLLEFDSIPPRIFQESDPFGFTGLHSCGNLSPLILHHYVNSRASFVVSLGCCYMKLTEAGFPLSDHAKSLNLHHSYEAFEVACHAIESYCQRLRSGQVKKLMTHSYRATLETILRKHGIRHAGLHSVPHTENLPFHEYALRATKSLPISLTEQELTSPQIESNLRDWFKVVLFYSLRLMIANVIESSILLDRALYLKCNSPHTYVLPCFSPETSPRNLGIVSFK